MFSKLLLQGERPDPDAAHSLEDVAKHNAQKDLWLVIEGKVYDVTEWAKNHPGGAAVLIQHAGRDATQAASMAHRTDKPAQLMKDFCIGKVVGGSSQPSEEPRTPRSGKVLQLAEAAVPTRRISVGVPPLPPVRGDHGGSSSSTSRLGAEEVKPHLKSTSWRNSAANVQVDSAASATIDPEGREADAEINVSTLEELRLAPEMIEQMKFSWDAFLTAAGSKEAAGELIYGALFESAPSLKSLFKTPRAVQALRFVHALNSIIYCLDKPKELIQLVEALGFGHLNIEVTIPRATIFRETILDMLEVEIPEQLTSEAKHGMYRMLNYVGGAMMFVKGHYATRLKTLEESWKKANSGKDDKDKNKVQDVMVDMSGELEADFQAGGETTKSLGAKSEATNKSGKGLESNLMKNGQGVPTTFKGMFEVNAAVMGISQSSQAWLQEVLSSFENIVVNVQNTIRLQEECDVLSLRISKTTRGANVDLAQFKACMLAALRSLLPKDWDSNHEVAWNWLWDNVERLLKQNLGKPDVWERALNRMLGSFSDSENYQNRKAIYDSFLSANPAGQTFFKQSDQRLHFIAESIIRMTSECFSDPWNMTDNISALGLRHVAYGIPTELFGPFTHCCVTEMQRRCQDEDALDAFRWALSLIAKMLVRTIEEGSTIVMKAINSNSVKSLRKSMQCAPRGLRHKWLLAVQVGTQSISPLMWAIESGRMDAAKMIIQDLLTIRADRERYYYGVEELFIRHPDLVFRLCTDAPFLLPPLLEGLVWRSRNTTDGYRRVNYFIKHLLIDLEGGISQNLQWLVMCKDPGIPKIMAHDVLVLVSDTLWSGLVRRQFVYSKVWFIVSLMTFMLSQALLPKSSASEELWCQWLIFVLRIGTYALTMLRLMVLHFKATVLSYREGSIFWKWRIPLPNFLKDVETAGSVVMMFFIIAMCVQEPMFWCFRLESDWLESNSNTDWLDCEEAEHIRFRYSVFCMFAMVIHWLLFMDLAVFSTGLSAFVLVISRVFSEIGRFLFALIFLLMTFGSAVSVLEHDYFEMRDIPRSALALFSITIRLYEDDYRSLLPYPALLMAVFGFVLASVVVLMNLLIAQINCSYVYIYQEMVGFARLNRADVIVETLESCSEKSWNAFIENLALDQPLEFNQGDVGLSGGIQVLEPASQHAVAADSIIRYGGSCSLDQPYPEEQTNQDEDNYEKVEKQLHRALKRLSKNRRRGGASTQNSGSSVASSDMGSTLDASKNSAFSSQSISQAG